MGKLGIFFFLPLLATTSSEEVSDDMITTLTTQAKEQRARSSDHTHLVYRFHFFLGICPPGES